MASTKQHILLIEDDEFLVNIYKTKFDMEGYKVSVETNGKDGLSAAAKKKPDVILLDILLPKMDGFNVLEELKASKKTQDIPVIVLTNLGQKADVDRAKSLGAADYLIKAHFKPSETVEKVERVISS